MQNNIPFLQKEKEKACIPLYKKKKRRHKDCGGAVLDLRVPISHDDVTTD